MTPLGLAVLSAIGVTLLVLYRLDLLHWGGRHPEKPAAQRQNPYPAVSIRCAGGCEAAHSIRGRRFLGDEAPSLPLEGCSAETCHCRYVHHVDRRTGILDRRRNRLEDTEYSSSEADQREGRGRRASDWIAAYRLNIPQT